MIVEAAAGCAGVLLGLLTHPAAAARTRRSPVTWDPPRRVVEGMQGPLVYVCRRRGTDEVKIGYSARTVGVRVSEWSTGTAGVVDVEAVFPAPQRAEARLHRVLRRHRIHGEWFRLDAGDPVWRAVVEREAARHT